MRKMIKVILTGARYQEAGMDPCLRREDGKGEEMKGLPASSSRRRGSMAVLVILAKAGIHGCGLHEGCGDGSLPAQG